MNNTVDDTPSDDLSDADVRGLLTQVRAEAPPPRGWHEVLDRYDQRSDRHDGPHRRWLALAAAAVVALGGVGLVVALQSRGDVSSEFRPLDEPTTDSLVATPDPLADLSDTEWVVPGVLPDGYEAIVAVGGGLDDRGGSLLIGGDEVPEVRISTQPPHVETVGDALEEGPVVANVAPTTPAPTVEVAGVEWALHTVVSDDGPVVGHRIEREVNDRLVTLTTSGDLDVLLQIAAGLHPVPDHELDVARLSLLDGEYTKVAEIGDVEVSARGINGVYCVRVEDPKGSAASSCGARTEPSEPVVAAVGSGGPDGSFTAGVAEPDVARIEFVRPNGHSVVVEPTDLSATFDHRFWVADESVTTEQAGVARVIVTYDDGTTATGHPAPTSGRWILDPA